jgi:hypothetical protein
MGSEHCAPAPAGVKYRQFIALFVARRVASPGRPLLAQPAPRQRLRSLLRDRARVSALGHKRTFHTLIRHVRFSAGTRPRDAIG